MARYVLRCGALGYLALLLLVPVGFVFYRAFDNGFVHAWDAVSSHQARTNAADENAERERCV